MVAFISESKRTQIENSPFIPTNLRDPKAVKGALGLTSSARTLWGSNSQLDAVHKAAELGYRSSLPTDHADYIDGDTKADLMAGLRSEYSYTLTGSNEITKPIGSVARGVKKFGLMGVGGGLVGFGVGFVKAAKFFTSNPNAGVVEKVFGAIIAVPFGVVAGAVTGVVGTLTGGLIAPGATGWLGRMKDKAMDMVGHGPESKVNDLLERAANLGSRAADEQKVSAKFATKSAETTNQNQNVTPETVQTDPAITSPQTTQPNTVNDTQTFVENQPQVTAQVAQSARAGITDNIELAKYDLAVIGKYMNDARVLKNPETLAEVNAAYEQAKTAALAAGMSPDDIKAVPTMETEQFKRLDAATLHDFGHQYKMDTVIGTTMNELGQKLVAEHRDLIGYKKEAAVLQTLEEKVAEAMAPANSSLGANNTTSTVANVDTVSNLTVTSEGVSEIDAKLKKHLTDKFADFETFSPELQVLLAEKQQAIIDLTENGRYSIASMEEGAAGKKIIDAMQEAVIEAQTGRKPEAKDNVIDIAQQMNGYVSNTTAGSSFNYITNPEKATVNKSNEVLV